MDRSSSRQSVSSTTKLVRVVISGVKKRSSPSEKLFSFLWIAGALLVIGAYVGIPILIALHQISNILIELFLAACILSIAELIVSTILLKIARPTRTPSVTPQAYQSKVHFFITSQVAQGKNSGGKSPIHPSVAGAARPARMDGTFAPTEKKPAIDQVSTIPLPVTPPPKVDSVPPNC